MKKRNRYRKNIFLNNENIVSCQDHLQINESVALIIVAQFLVCATFTKLVTCKFEGI